MYNILFYSPLPNELDLVYCHFPDRKRFPSLPLLEDLIPYNDPHYCMVLGSIDGNNDVIVVYGTSKINTVTSNDFILEKQYLSGTGLSLDTKWSFTPSNIAILPYSNQFFSKKFNYLTPRIGRFPSTQKENLLKIIHHNNVQNILNDLFDSPYAMLPEKFWDLQKYKI